ncbi:MAG TPA: hypothetical protein VN752_05565 [Solirubrobacterales bacterium]|nr:hypothetical protein [Solirubrobacterales bacterium]
MSTERIERIRAEEARVGDRIKAPDGRAFYELTVAHPKPGLENDEEMVELGTGWGSVVLQPGEIVERENWQVGEAEREIEEHKRSRLDDIAALVKLASLPDDEALNEWSNDELLAHDIGYGEAGPLSLDTVREQADERLNEYPLSVEATMTFEVVIGTGGPDDRLLFECVGVDAGPHDGGGDRWEINRVIYRYSWTGSAERVLSGEDRETAEELARRVVPELVE